MIAVENTGMIWGCQFQGNAPKPRLRQDRGMNPKDTRLDKVNDESPLENQPLEWDKEDIQIEDRKPDLAEIEEDESAL
jgi:hypothetical protein